MSEIANQFRGSRLLVFLASLVVVVAGLRAIKPIALPFVIATFLAVISAPVVTWLVGRRFPRPLAVAVAVLTNIAAVLVIITAVGGSFGAFTNSIPEYRQALEREVREGLDWLESHGFTLSEELSWLQEVLEEPGDEVTDQPVDDEASPEDTEDGATPGDDSSPNVIDVRALVEAAVGGVVGLVGTTLRGLAELATMAVMIVFMLFFILLEAAELPRKLQLAFGWKKHEIARMSRARREIQRYLGIKTAVSLLTGLLIGLWVWAVGLDYPQLWGLIAFLLNYIPNIGSFVASVPAVLVSMLELGAGSTVLVIFGYLATNLLMGNLVEPQLMGRQLGISTLVVFLSLVFWGWTWGPLGMLLSVPLTVVLKILLEHSPDFRWFAQLIASGPLAPLPRKSSAP